MQFNKKVKLLDEEINCLDINDYEIENSVTKMYTIHNDSNPFLDSSSNKEYENTESTKELQPTIIDTSESSFPSLTREKLNNTIPIPKWGIKKNNESQSSQTQPSQPSQPKQSFQSMLKEMKMNSERNAKYIMENEYSSAEEESDDYDDENY